MNNRPTKTESKKINDYIINNYLKKSGKYIAKHLNISEEVVRKRAYDLNFRKAKLIDKDAVISLYVGNELNCKDISEILKCTLSPISRILRNSGIEYHGTYQGLLKGYKLRKIVVSDKGDVYGLTFPKKIVKQYKLEGKLFKLKQYSGKTIIYEQ